VFRNISPFGSVEVTVTRSCEKGTVFKGSDPIGAGFADPWEKAYARFQSPQEEVHKFVKRLKMLGVNLWPRQSKILEMFCGRGNGLEALRILGFDNIEGIDLSASLLSQYHGPARCWQGDCRSLPFDNCTKDAVIVQGGLHHLRNLADDLEQVLREAHRVLKDDGLIVIVEPWQTPFLTFVHLATQSHFVRRLSRKLDALGEMIDHERTTYLVWLSCPHLIWGVAARYFDTCNLSIRWGKIMFVGTKRGAEPSQDRCGDSCEIRTSL
jgi:SAM-dependent methyltransferase